MRLSINLLLAALLLPTLARAATIELPNAAAPGRMTLDQRIGPPRGYAAFCQGRPGECGATAREIATIDPAAPRSVRSITRAYNWTGVFAAPATTPKGGPGAAVSARGRPSAVPKALWVVVTGINAKVNRAISPREDLANYGASDVWAMPLQAGRTFGDCEDYVLEKRHALVIAGVPARDLSIAVVTTVQGDAHAVLLVDTPAGEYVLDNRTPWVLPWQKARYQWGERQVAGSALNWSTVRRAAISPAKKPVQVVAAARNAASAS